MENPIQDSGSSKKLEGKILATPLRDVSLVIVHVNDEYESLACCEGRIRRLMDERIAAHVYEHSTYGESILKKILGLDWEGGLRTASRYADYDINGIFYHIVDNETDPGNYDIENLYGRRLIIVGGSLDNCHRSASRAAAQYLYDIFKGDQIREVHLPADCIYKTDIKSDSGDSWLDSNITHDYKTMQAYIEIMKKVGRSYFVSLDRLLTSADFSVEEPTLHLAVWTSTDKMVDYLRNNRRLLLTAENSVSDPN